MKYLQKRRKSQLIQQKKNKEEDKSGKAKEVAEGKDK